MMPSLSNIFKLLFVFYLVESVFQTVFKSFQCFGGVFFRMIGTEKIRLEAIWFGHDAVYIDHMGGDFLVEIPIRFE